MTIVNLGPVQQAGLQNVITPTNIADALAYINSVPPTIIKSTAAGLTTDLAAAGGGSWSQTENEAYASTGANANATCGGVYNLTNIRPTGENVNRLYINWDKFFAFNTIVFLETSVAASTAYIKISEDTAHAALASKGMAISCANLTMSGHHYDSQIRSTSSIYTVTTGQHFNLTFIHIPTVGEYIYVDGSQKYAVTTNLVSGNSGAQATLLVSRGTAGTAASAAILVARFSFWFPRWL